MNLLWLLSLFVPVMAQTCSRITPASIVDLDNATLAGNDVLNLVRPVGAMPPAVAWDPAVTPSTGYHSISVTFAAPAVVTSCEWRANTNGTRSPTGLRFFSAPGGLLLATTQNLTTPMTAVSYTFPMNPSPALSSIYVQIYKSTPNPAQMYSLSCSTCVAPNATATIITERLIDPSQVATILGSVGVGAGTLSLVILVAAYLSKFFRPGPDGKRPTLTEAFEKAIGTAKTQAEAVVKEVGETSKQQALEFVKDPKNVMEAIKDPKAAVQKAKEAFIETVKESVEKNVSEEEKNIVLRVVHDDESTSTVKGSA
jgi:hypothetical protein